MTKANASTKRTALGKAFDRAGMDIWIYGKESSADRTVVHQVLTAAEKYIKAAGKTIPALSTDPEATEFTSDPDALKMNVAFGVLNSINPNWEVELGLSEYEAQA